MPDNEKTKSQPSQQERTEFSEGSVKKGGVNQTPSTPAPGEPAGQGGKSRATTDKK